MATNDDVGDIRGAVVIIVVVEVVVVSQNLTDLFVLCAQLSRLRVRQHDVPHLKRQKRKIIIVEYV